MALGGVSLARPPLRFARGIACFHYEALFGVWDSRGSCQSGFSYDLTE
jgi:hypothetical protein